MKVVGLMKILNGYIVSSPTLVTPADKNGYGVQHVISRITSSIFESMKMVSQLLFLISVKQGQKKSKVED